MLAKNFIVFEFDGLEMQYQNLFVSYLLSMLFAQRVENRSNELVVVALDEASRLYSKKAEAANEGPSYISTMTSVIRSMYIALLVFTQSCYDLSNSIIANSGIKILCRVGAAGDYDTFGRAMGLTSPQIQWCKTNLDIGMQIIKMGFGWLRPFINRTPLITLPGDVTDYEVRQSSRILMDMVPQPTRPVLLLPEKIEMPTANAPATPTQILGEDEELLLKQIECNSHTPSATTHYKNAGLSSKRGTAAKQILIDRNLIKETSLESGRRGRAQLFLELVANSGRHGNALHCYLRNIADEWYRRRNCTTEFERSIQVDGEQKFVDLSVIWPDGKTEAVEIETADSQRAIENIRKNIAGSYDAISILTPNSKTRVAIEKRFVPENVGSDMPEINFKSLADYTE